MAPSKKMTFVAAANMARKAKTADPSITSLANRYIKSYAGSAPSKKLVFTEGLKSGDLVANSNTNTPKLFQSQSSIPSLFKVVVVHTW